MKRLMVFLLSLMLVCYSDYSFAGDGYFQPMWDFFEWLYDIYADIKNSMMQFAIEMWMAGFFWYIKIKIEAVVFIWSVVEPIIDSLNLTNVITTAFGNLPTDIKAFITQIRLAEGINILASAKITRMIIDFIGW